MDLAVHPLHIPFRRAFGQASKDRSVGEAVFVEARSGEWLGLGEGCPRDYVTGETLSGALEWIEARRPALSALDDLEHVRAYVAEHRTAIDASPAAWCAVESAVLDLVAQRAGVTVEGLLGVPEERTVLAYTGVIPAGSTRTVAELAGAYLGLGLADLKVKVGVAGADDVARVAAVRAAVADAGRPIRIRLDANNAWGSDPTAAIEALRPLCEGVVAVEEPLAAGRLDDLRHISDALGIRIVLDESLTRIAQIPSLVDDPERWLANVKVSKAGGSVRAVALVEALTEAGIDVIVGAQVGETSVLTRLGWVAARAAGDRLWAIEGGVGTMLLQHDAVFPELRFGAGGRLDLARAGLGPTGLGLRRVEDR